MPSWSYAARCTLGLLWLLLSAPAAPAGPYDHGLLWRVEKDGAAPSFVFGTVHVDDPRVTQLPVPVARRFDAAGGFAMEVVFDPAVLAQLANRMMYADGRDLQQVAGDALYARVAAAGGALGLPAEALRRFKPWAVAMMLILPQQQGVVLDLVLMQRAQAQRKPVHGLETAEEQIALFEDLPERDQLLMLRHTVDNLDTVRRGVGELVEAWLARDLAALARISDRDTAADPELRRFSARFREKVIDERNLRMVQRLRPHLEQGSLFVAVGALHLHGARGVLALLAGEGYAVTREY